MNKLIVGLGNPGAQYRHTRHNVGFMVLDQLKSRVSEGVETTYRDEAWLLKPGVFMNLSGGPVQRIAAKHAVAPSDTLIVCDDFALPLGQLRLRNAGSSGGHNGLEHIIATLGTAEFPRLRVGIGPVPPAVAPADFVLSEFTVAERPAINTAVADAARAVNLWIERGTEAAMNEFNRRLKED